MDLQQTALSLLAPTILYPTLAALAGVVLGWVVGYLAAWGRARRHFGAGAQGEEAESRDLRKTVYLLQNDNTKLSTFLMTLPDLARQLNSNMEKRKIPHLLITFIEQLFDAEQILVFLTTLDGKCLTLAAAKGVPDDLRGHCTVPFGKGRIGWVAVNQITMDESEFVQKSRVSKGEIEGNVFPAFRTELCAPMASKEKTLGVISLGGLLRRPKNEKNMLKMVADLGSIAIQNTTLIGLIQDSANSDGLTGLPNKRFFMQRLAEEIIRSEKEQRTMSLFLFDLDHFKVYNDTNGHLAGDEALRITGRLMRETLRADDMPARYGGEEFVVLLPNTDKPGAVIAAEKIRSAIEQFAYPNEQSQPGGRVTLSGGVATFPYDGKTMADLIRCADEALYAGKKQGRNRVCVYEPKYLSDETGTDVRRLADRQKM